MLQSENLSLTISTALVLIGEMGAPTGIDGAEAQLSDAIPQEKDEGSTSWHVDFRLAFYAASTREIRERMKRRNV